jgi:anti-sigma-K factor RskA
MRDDSSSDALVTRYLLGDLSEEDQAKIEGRAFRDRQYLLEIEAVECDLIDDYVRGALSEGQRRQFEDRFLRSAERRRKLKFAKALETVAGEFEI